MNAGPPLGFPGSVFEYSDTNYLLLTEIIEEVTGLPFYQAMRELLQYEANGLYDIWFPTLEEQPANTLPRVHQYWDKVNLSSYDFDVSVDLYGGGGIACSTRDLALFNYKLFNGEIVKDKVVLDLIYADYPTRMEDSHYHLGIGDYEVDGQKAYGHSGFWGTKVMYFPELQTAISVFILVKDYSSINNEVIADLLKQLASS
jgi:D-alanyl-D-alanine carboxypeptidase